MQVADMSLHLLLLSTLVGASSPMLQPAPAPAGQDLHCPMRWGEPGRPLVANAETANAIFSTVEREFFPAANSVHFPKLA
jgi:hypothetical protein